MEQMVTELTSILKDEEHIHEALVRTAQEMNRSLKKKDIEAIPELTARYDDCAAHIEELEEKRLAVCDQIAACTGKPNGHPSLATIASLIPEEKRTPLAKLHESLKTKISELSKLNVSNQILLQESLSGVRMSFEVLTQSEKAHAGYRSSGNKEKTPAARHLVNHIA